MLLDADLPLHSITASNQTETQSSSTTGHVIYPTKGKLVFLQAAKREIQSYCVQCIAAAQLN